MVPQKQSSASPPILTVTIIAGCPMVSSINIVRKQTQLSLVHLDMSECSALDDTGLNMIVLNCPQMTQLYLRKCSNITGITRENKIKMKRRHRCEEGSSRWNLL